MYEYKAKVINLVDGDTIDAVVDLGFHLTATLRFRLNRINTPEVRGPEKIRGKKATEYLRLLLSAAEDKTIIKTEKTGKYGRWLAEIFIKSDFSDEYVNINDLLVKSGHAEYKKY